LTSFCPDRRDGGGIDYFEFNGVNQYTDDEGVWEWNEAPVDEFEADICRADGMQLQSQPIAPRPVMNPEGVPQVCSVVPLQGTLWQARCDLKRCLRLTCQSPLG
jgi:hypothetical protein